MVETRIGSSRIAGQFKLRFEVYDRGKGQLKLSHTTTGFDLHLIPIVTKSFHFRLMSDFGLNSQVIEGDPTKRSVGSYLEDPRTGTVVSKRGSHSQVD